MRRLAMAAAYALLSFWGLPACPSDSLADRHIRAVETADGRAYDQKVRDLMIAKRQFLNAAFLPKKERVHVRIVFEILENGLVGAEEVSPVTIDGQVLMRQMSFLRFDAAPRGYVADIEWDIEPTAR